MASSKENKSYKDAVDSAMTVVSERYPEMYKSVMSDPKNKKKIHEEARKHVDEIMTVINNVRDKGIKSEDALSHLSEERQEKFKRALEMKTFVMKIKKTDGVSKVEVTRGDKQFRPTMNLSTADEVNTASIYQTASIVIECVILVLEVIGVVIPDDADEVENAIQIAIDQLGKSATLTGDVAKIQEAYQKGDTLGMAMAIFTLVIDVFHEGIFWDITKALLSDMPWYDWVATAAKIAAQIAIIVATGGAAEIAELVSILVDAAFFIEKLANLSSFQTMKKHLTE